MFMWFSSRKDIGMKHGKATWDCLKSKIIDGIKQDESAIKSAIKMKDYASVTGLAFEKSTLEHVLNVIIADVEKENA